MSTTEPAPSPDVTPTTIRRVLVANRGEIARRVLASCRRLGVETVAVHSTADADAPFVREADTAVAIGPAPSAESYLRAERVIEAARSTGADAIHPGYGFLSEDPSFADAVVEAGLTWLGPSGDVMRAMGSKLRARERMQAAGVPVLPGAHVEDDVSDEDLRARAEEIGFPLLVKASAGGGGRGMRRVQEPGALQDAVRDARREAESSFGDGTVFLERFVQRPRHVEVQILGDRHGTLSALSERDCTAQRRHQKLLEEAPAPALGEDVRRRLHDAARRAGRELGYVGAGTVEFVLSPEDDEAYFLEVNARLQVEHPVTEAVCGLDLVALQVRIAEGEPLPPEAVDPAPSGHAIEARLVAEDPARAWAPQAGPVVAHRIAHDAAFALPAADGSGSSVRLDAAVQDGGEVSPHYDSLVAKVIVHAPTRAAATRLLARTLREASLAGPLLARDLLVRVLESDAWAAVTHDTQMLDGDAAEELSRPLAGVDEVRRAAVAASLAAAAARRAAAPVLAEVPSGFRNVGRQPQRVAWSASEEAAIAAEDEDAVVVEYRLDRDGRPATLEVDGEAFACEEVDATADRVAIVERGVRRTLRVLGDPAGTWVHDGRCEVRLHERPRLVDPNAVAAPGSLLAPLPGAVLRVHVAEGDAVSAGDPLVVLEAMKMEHTVAADVEGVVAELPVSEGAQVSAGDVLVVLEEPDGDDDG